MMLVLGARRAIFGKSRKSGTARALPELPGLQRWYDASDASTITITAGKVSQWADKSGNSAHATQPDAARRLTVAAGSFNGLTSLSGSGAGMVVPNLALPSTNYVFVVASTTTNSMLVDSGSVFYCLWASGNTLYSNPNNSEATLAVAGASNGAAHIFGRTSGPTAAQSLMLFDGTGTQKPTYTAVVNGMGTYSNGGLAINGKIAEVIIGNQALSVAQINEVSVYLKTKWGTP